MNEDRDPTAEQEDTSASRRSTRTTPEPSPTPAPVAEQVEPTEEAQVREDLQADDDGNVPVQRSGGGADNRVPADQSANEEGGEG